jgi:ribosomal protein L1
MAADNKRKKAAREKIDSEKAYILDDALSLVKEFATAKFPESIDVSVNLGVDPRKSDQVVRGSTVLPNGTGKTVRVAVFAQGENADKAPTSLVLTILPRPSRRASSTSTSSLRRLTRCALLVSSARFLVLVD